MREEAWCHRHGESESEPDPELLSLEVRFVNGGLPSSFFAFTPRFRCLDPRLS